MTDGCFILEVGGVGDSVVILLFLEVIWRGENLVNIYCLFCRIFRLANRITFLLLQSSANLKISFANHFDGSCGISLVYRWRVSTS